MTQRDIEWFNKEKGIKNPIFFNRFSQINYQGLTVLDLGCGHGAIAIDLAMKGAKKIIGVDIKCSIIDFANENLNTNYPDLIDKITFKCIDLRDLDDDYFDIIISKASFEHIVDLDILLVEMKKKLKVGGNIITGFGPLYNAPWGDHNRLRHILPWSHLIFGAKHFIKKINVKRKKKVESVHDLGLNGYSLKDYLNAFNNTEGLSIVKFRTNVSDNPVMKISRLISVFPFLKEYFTYNIYCVLERTK